MAIDSSIYNNVGRPSVALLNPLDIQAKKIFLRNALAQGTLQDQQVQSGQMALEQERLGQAQNAQYMALVNGGGTGNALASPQPGPPVAPGPAMAPAGDVPAGLPGAPAFTPPDAPPPAAADAAPAARAPHTVSDDELRGIFGMKAEGMIEKRNLAKKTQTETQEVSARLQALDADYWGHWGGALKDSGYDQRAVVGVLSAIAADGKQNTPQYQALLKAAQSDPASIPQLAEMAIGRSKEMQAQKSATATSDAAKSNAANTTRTTDETVAEKSLLRRSQLLKSTGADPKAYKAVYDAIESKSPGELAAQGFDAPDKWTPKSSALAGDIGLTSNEKTTATETAKRDAATDRHNRADEVLSAARVSIERDRLSYDKQGGGSLSDPNYLAGVVRGEIQLNPRDKNFAAASAAAKGLDPSWTSDRFGIAHSWRQSLSSGPESRKLASINQGVAHLGELKAASQNLGNNLMQYTPGVVSQFSGDVKTYKDSLSTSGAEIATMLAQGQATVDEHHTVIRNLDSPSPSARLKGIDQYAKLIGGRLRAVAKAHAAATGEVFPVDQYVDSAAIEMLKQHKVDVYAIADQEKPHWMKAKNESVAGVAAAGGVAAAPAAPAAAAPVEHHGVPDLGSTFNGGKVLKVTRIP